MVRRKLFRDMFPFRDTVPLPPRQRSTSRQSTKTSPRASRRTGPPTHAAHPPGWEGSACATSSASPPGCIRTSSPASPYTARQTMDAASVGPAGRLGVGRPGSRTRTKGVMLRAGRFAILKPDHPAAHPRSNPRQGQNRAAVSRSPSGGEGADARHQHQMPMPARTRYMPEPHSAGAPRSPAGQRTRSALEPDARRTRDACRRSGIRTRSRSRRPPLSGSASSSASSATNAQRR